MKYRSMKELYDSNINIMQFFREKEQVSENNLDAILYAYDLQAGNYVSEYNSGRILEEPYLVDGEKVFLSEKEFKHIYGKKMAYILNQFSFNSLLEVGVGEATALCDIAKNLNTQKKLYGLDLSLSRLLFAEKFLQDNELEAELSVGDMFHLPYLDSSVDIVFTSNCIEPNTGREKEAVEELYRVAKKYVIMVEPSYELGNENTKKRITEHKYIRNLQQSIKEMQLPVAYHSLFSATSYNNNSAVTIIEKNTEVKYEGGDICACPHCGQKLQKYKGNFYCPDCFLVYPVIGDIGILTEENAILCSKYMEIDENK